jgi:hypothetical protein
MKISKNYPKNLTLRKKKVNFKVTVGKNGELWSEILLNFKG